jgi:hypothetical protein
LKADTLRLSPLRVIEYMTKPRAWKRGGINLPPLFFLSWQQNLFLSSRRSQVTEGLDTTKGLYGIIQVTSIEKERICTA